MNGKDEIMEMPAEVDFSDSVPNPYIGKVRCEVMKTVVNKDAKDWTLDEQEAVAEDIAAETGATIARRTPTTCFPLSVSNHSC